VIVRPMAVGWRGSGVGLWCPHVTRIGSSAGRAGWGGAEETGRTGQGSVPVHPPVASGGDAAWGEPWRDADYEQIGLEVAGDGDDHVTGVAGDQDRAGAHPARPRDLAGIQ
jgi:hypothetical protein